MGRNTVYDKNDHEGYINLDIIYKFHRKDIRNRTQKKLATHLNTTIGFIE